MVKLLLVLLTGGALFGGLTPHVVEPPLLIDASAPMPNPPAS